VLPSLPPADCDDTKINCQYQVMRYIELGR
jgi:hypothetical protein